MRSLKHLNTGRIRGHEIGRGLVWKLYFKGEGQRSDRGTRNSLEAYEWMTTVIL